MAIVGFNLYLNGQKVNDAPIPRLGSVTEYEFSDLNSGTEYTVGVSSVNDAGREGPIFDLGTIPTEVYTPVGDEMSPADMAKVDAVMERCLNQYNQGPGLMLYTTGPKGTMMKAYGWADSAKTIPLTTDMHFRVGSHTKSMTACAVLMAVDKGLLSLEDTIDQFDSDRWTLSDLPNADKITIRHLLMMRAGLFNEQRDLGVLLMFLLNKQYPWSDDATLRVLKSHPADAEPGTAFSYVSGNYAVLGAILEAVDGRPARQIIKEDIWDVLGMTETSWGGLTLPAPAPRGYGGMGQLTADYTNMNPELAGLAGAVVSTMADLHKWLVAQRDNLFLSQELWELQNSTGCWMPAGTAQDEINEGKPKFLAYGMANYLYGSWRSHGGSWTGFECVPMWNIDNGAIMIVVENSQSPDNKGVAATPMLRTLPMLCAELYPDSINDPPEAERNVCTVPSDPFVHTVAPGNRNYGGVSPAFKGLGTASINWAPGIDQDVFAVVCWDRNGSTIPTAEFGGEEMDLVGYIPNDNNTTYGGTAIYRIAKAGNGTPKLLKITGSGAWISAYGVAFENVVSVDPAETATGYGVVAEKAVTNESGLTLVALGSGAGGGPSYDWGFINLGARTRAKQEGTNPALLVATTHMSMNMKSTAKNKNRWGMVTVHINFEA